MYVCMYTHTRTHTYKQSPTAEQRPPHAVTIVYIRYERRFYVEGFGFRI